MTIPHALREIPPLPGIDGLLGEFDGLALDPPRGRLPAPLLVLSQDGPGGGEAASVVDGLYGRCVDSAGRALAPVTRWPAPGDPDRGGQLWFYQRLADGLRGATPPDVGRLKLRDFRLMRAVLTARLTAGGSATREAQLRRAVHAEFHAGRPAAPEPVLAVLPWIVALLTWLWSLATQPLLGLRVNRAMMRGWFADWSQVALGAKQDEFFRPAVGLAPGGSLHQPRHIDAVLTRALLADLERALRPRWWSPWRRRRTTRAVLLLTETEPVAGGPPEPPDEGAHGAELDGVDLVRGFLLAYTSATERRPTTATLVVAAAGRETIDELGLESVDSTRLPAWLGERRSRESDAGPPHCAVRLAPAGSAHTAAERWLQNHPKLPQRSGPHHGPVGAAVLQWVSLATVAALVYGGLGAAGVPIPLVGPAGGPCPEGQFPSADGESCLGLSDGSARFRGSAPAYDALMEVLRENNAAVDDLGPKHQKRTVVVFQPFAAKGVHEGVLLELRGILLQQRKILDGITSNNQNVAVRILLANSGRNFEEGPKVARMIVDRAEQTDIVGVIGVGQSRKETEEAVEVLADESIPVISTSATADKLAAKTVPYYQIAPNNSRAAQAAAAFLRHEGFIPLPSGEPARAQEALVVYAPDDLYSTNLATRFQAEFRKEVGGEVEMLDQGPHALARRVCERLNKEPRTVVFWAGRAGDLSSFLRAYSRLPDCKSHVSVLGGDDLTNSMIQETNPLAEYPELTLHRLVHAVPGTDAPTPATRSFRQAYTRAHGRGSKGLNDARPALGWDALMVLSHALDRTGESGAGGTEFHRTAVSATLRSSKNAILGATGRLAFHVGGESVQVPPDKPIYVVHDTEDGPRIVLKCGNFGAGIAATKWGAGAFDCPRD